MSPEKCPGCEADLAAGYPIEPYTHHGHKFTGLVAVTNDGMNGVDHISPLPSRPGDSGGGLRFNAGKNQLDLLPPEWTWGLGMVLTRGTIKYAVRNWEMGMKWSYPVACIFRHVFKFICGERYDAETGCHHLAMAAWNCLALMSYDIREVGENDLVGELGWLNKVAIAPGPALQKIIDQREAEMKEQQTKEKAA